eukprot:TRINITY_DN1269_c1_g1_i3.p1 TRINITY_DN1269_c1_g1~~TRINITY_DN1269_c1_g1_i3.p1  ORF type:complete len:170 (-),score=43.91 TRINITY_DN1269_c1_g1_i3:71-580(-)
MSAGRETKLRKVFEKALESSISQCSYEKFVSWFPELPKTQREWLYSVYEQFVQMLRSNSLAEYEKICDEMNLHERLAELEKLVKTASAEEKEQQEGISYLTEEPELLIKRVMHEDLKTEEQELEAELKRVQEDIEASTSRIEKSCDGIQSMFSEIEGTDTSLQFTFQSE